MSARVLRLLLVAALLASCATSREAPVVERSTGQPAAVPREPVAPPPRAPSPAVVERAPAPREAPARPSSPPSRAAPAAPTHTVVAGETLYGIAFRHGLDHRELARWNAIEPPYRLSVGRTLRLAPPNSAVVSAPPTSQPEPPAARMNPGMPIPAPTTPVVAADPPPATITELAPMPEPEPVVTVDTRSAPAVGAHPVRDSQSPASAPAPAPTPLPATAPEPAQSAPVEAAPAKRLAGRTVAGIRWQWPARGRVIQRFVGNDPARQGLDIAGAQGEPVLAAADGEIVYSGNGLIGYGELVIIKHDAEFLSAYGHNRRRLVAEGQRVRAGQQIAEMGRSGAALDLLHFEIRRGGRPVDPAGYLPRR